MFKKCTLALLLALFVISARAQNQLNIQVDELGKAAKGIIGYTVLNLETRDSVSYNGNARMVMQSVMKFPIALAVLDRVDKGKLKLDQTIHIAKRDLPPTHSPLRDKYPEGKVDIAISELINYMVTQSDNNACDILIKKLGGTQAVMDYLHGIGIKGIAINASEADMATAWEVQYTDWCKPADMVHLLDVFYQGKAVSQASTDYLMKVMLATATGPKQIKGLLPEGTPVAHKTGRSDTNSAGLSPATNDVGIITLPNGNHLAVAIFICNSTAADLATREEVIAKIAKAAYDAGLGK